MLAGLADSTLTRDEGWSFLVLGRNLERVDMTARLLSARYAETWGPTVWATTLRCCSAYEAYLRTYRHGVDASSALEFLLLDRLFPRSVLHALTTAQRALGELDPRAGRTGVDDDARRILGRSHAELSFLRVSDAAADLPELLEHLQDATARGPHRDHEPVLPRHPGDRVERMMRSAMTGWRLRVRHHTGFSYGSDVHASYNEARLTPPDTASQSVIESRVDVQPGAALTKYRDYWGTWVHAFDINRSHRELSVAGLLGRRDGRRATHRRTRARRGRTCGRTEVQDTWCEYLSTTLYTAVDDQVQSLAGQLRGRARRRVKRSKASSAWIHDGMEYEKGSTTVTTTAPEALQARHGVCQDFAHLGLALGAQPRHPGPLRVRLPAPVGRGRADRRGDRGREPRVDRDVAGGVGAARSHQRRDRRPAPRRGRPRPRLRRRARR